MNERLTRLEAVVGDMETTVTRLAERVALLEGREPDTPGTSLPLAKGGSGDDLESEAPSPFMAVAGTPGLVGRSLLVLAGAFLLRALTENGSFAPMVGVAVGVAYAAGWILASGVAASRGGRASAGFYAACSALIVDPLLLEASTSFGVLSPTASAVALAMMTAGGLLVAALWRLQSTAWVFSIGGLVTGVAMAKIRPPGEAATAFLVLLGLAIFWLADEYDWDVLKWVTAFAADLAVVRLTAIATAPDARPESFGLIHPQFVVALQLVLVVGFVGTVVVRALRGRRSLKVFDFVQTLVVWLVTWGGAVSLARVQGWDLGGLSLIAVVAGLAAYGGAFGVVDRRQGRNLAFYYLSSVGLGLVLLGLPGVFGEASAIVWAIVAVVLAAVGSRWDRVTLRGHATVLLMAAWLAGGVVSVVVARLAGYAEVLGGGPAVGATAVALLTVVATAVVLFGRRPGSAGWVQRLPLTAMLAMSALALATAIASIATVLVASDTAIVAGTVALSAVTVGLAVMTFKAHVTEAGWLVYPFLVITGLRMMAVDLSSGRTVVFVIALAAYGAALIVSTRLLRASRSSHSPNS